MTPRCLWGTPARPNCVPTDRHPSCVKFTAGEMPTSVVAQYRVKYLRGQGQIIDNKWAGEGVPVRYNQSKENHMTGNIYTGVVVVTEQVPIGGVTSAPQSTIVYAETKPFIATSDDLARAHLLMKAKVDINDASKQVEVKIAKFGA